MAANTFRFQWKGNVLSDLQRSLAVGSIITTSNISKPIQWVDVTIDPSGPEDISNLNEVMETLGWIPYAVAPTTPLMGITLRQQIPLFLNVDSQNVDDTQFTDLLTTPITNELPYIRLEASLSGVGSSLTFFRITIDGVSQVGAIMNGGGGSACLRKNLIVPPGPHIIALQWKPAAESMSEIRPITNPDSEHASLAVGEFAP